MFVDHAKIQVKAGDGGKGCESYYFARGMRHERRDGGDGGNGGNILLRADENVHTLLDLRYRQHFKADNGKHGSSNLKAGADAADRIILVPPGTIVRDVENGFLLRDLNAVQEQVIVAQGGKGGVGNAKGKLATEGQRGQERTISLELKLIADVGLIGYPNAGKSSFLNLVSHAQSKVAHFPFTTLSPVLGVMQSPRSEKRCVVADIPGLIKDAHKGKGLGIEFLRHIERTKMLLFILDMAGVDGRDPLDDYENLIRELELYDRLLLKRPQCIVANKMDLPEAKGNFARFQDRYGIKPYRVSCFSRTGIAPVVTALFKQVFSKKKPAEDKNI
ncbi:MAG: Obg family GTPase CgtA [Candidatus Omnitrophica bacterium]|nr:Obg family GTPase CgtA [Candidatus Omnitrophota bacterium]